LLPLFPLDISLLLIALIPVAIWSYFWKALGLWFSARDGERAWFTVFIFVNLAGILELYYLHSRKCWPFKAKQ
jgi:hypothetical protein